MRRLPLVVLTLLLVGLAFVAIRSSEERPETPSRANEVLVAPGPAILLGRIVDERGDPIENVEVLASNQDSQFDWPLDAPAWVELERAPNRTYSDADGLFELDGLQSGLARVSLRKSEFALRDLRNLSLTPNNETQLGEVNLQPATRVRGRIVSHSGNPVADANVFFLRPETSLPYAHPWTGILVASANSRGEFEVRNLEPGPFTLAIDAPGKAPHRIEGFVATEVELGEIQLPEPSSISGIVLDFPQGDLSDLRVVALPTRAAQFAVRPNGHRGTSARWLEGYVTTTIGAEAGFRLTGLKPDTYYSLRVLAPADELRTSDAWSPPRLVLSGAEDVVLTVHPSVRMDFRVIDAESGDPIEEFAHFWSGARNLPRQGVDFLRATSNDRRVTLHVYAAGYAPYRSTPLALIEANPLQPLQVELVRAPTEPARDSDASQAAERTRWLDSLPGFESRPKAAWMAPVGARNGSLSGAILEQGEPLVGAVVKLFPAREREEFFEAYDDAIQAGRTDRDGRFVLHHVPAGEYSVSIAHASRAQVALRKVDTRSSPVEFELERVAFRGRVVTADGAPASEAEIHLPLNWKRERRALASDGDGDLCVVGWHDAESPPLVATTDAEGRFVLEGLERTAALTLGARSARLGVGLLRLAELDEEATVLLSSNSTLLVEGYDPKPLERALGVAWRWGRDYDHEIRFAFAPPFERRFRGLSADEWTLFQAEIDGWGEISSMRVLSPALLSPVGETHVQLRR